GPADRARDEPPVGPAAPARDRRGLPRDFWYYLTGQAVSALGSAFTWFAIPLVVFRLTGSATALGATLAVSFAPYLLFGLVLGALVDRLDRKRLMVAVELARAAMLALLAVAGLAGTMHVVFLYAASFLVTTLRIAFDAGRFAAVATMARGEQLVTANARVESALAVARVVGPALAGALVAVLPVATAFAVDAASYLVSAT